MSIYLVAARLAAILLYAAVYLTVLAEAVASCKVLKAQLLMIRQQRVDPRSCPAWAKFRLFTWLRRYVLTYLAVEAVLIVLQLLQLPWMWDILANIVWELMQVCIAGAVGWVFGGTAFNHFVESERHMMPSEVATSTLLAPSDMSLAWQEDDDEVLSAWQATTLVPPPPEAPALISALARTTNQAAVSRARNHRLQHPSPGAARQEVTLTRPSVELAAALPSAAAVAAAAPAAAVQGAHGGLEVSQI